MVAINYLDKMTKEQLKQKIAQATKDQKDVPYINDGALATVLNAIVDLIPAVDAPIEVEDITALTDAQLDALEVGAKVAKKTGTAKHLYVVSYKDAENGGLCLTYTDASTVETVSYDHTVSGWTYNSTDKTNIGG